MRETDLMFCCGFNPGHSQKLAEMISKKGKVNWSQIESQLYLEKFKRNELARAMFFFFVSSPINLMPLSGPLLISTSKKTVLHITDMFLENRDFISFTERKPIHALYLTPLTVDGRFLTDWVRPAENSWGAFITQCLILKEVPDNFPLHEMPTGFLPEQLFLILLRIMEKGQSWALLAVV